MKAFRREISNVGKATQRIVQDLAARHRDGTFEVFLDKCGMPRPSGHRGSVEEMLQLFHGHCSDFPGAWVSYHPEHAYGIVAVVVGHCGERKEECTRMCSNFRERPRATLILTEAKGRDILLGHGLVSPESGR